MEGCKKIVVVGSTNVDLIARVSHLPKPGETIGGAEYKVSYGGKGANQAIAAARSGGCVTFVSCLGDDAYADALISSFSESGINVDYVQKCTGQSTGVAFIFVAESGENCIAVAPGANNLLRKERIEAIFPIIEEADALVLQLEIPYESVTTLIEYAHGAGTKVVLNPAPARQIPFDILEKVDVLILNETEALFIAGKSLTVSEPVAIAQSLHRREGQVLILTLGQKGSVIVSDEVKRQIPSYTVKAADTTGAGDTFCGAFVARWIDGESLQDCVQFATAAAALSVTKIGAQTSIPYEKDVLEFMYNRTD